MIHTILLRLRITSTLYRQIADELDIDITRYIAKTRSYNSYGFRTIWLKRTERRISTYYSIEILFNPNVMILGRETIPPISYADIPMIADAFSRTMRNIIREMRILGQLLPFSIWQCKRIDYCVDITPPNADMYIDLICRADKPSERFTALNRRGSLYLMSNAVTINFYSKD